MVVELLPAPGEHPTAPHPRAPCCQSPGRPHLLSMYPCSVTIRARSGLLKGE